MKNVIYTSYGFGVGELHGQFQNEHWTTIQRDKINNYCEKQNIALKVIDYENKFMKALLKNLEPHRDIDKKSFSVYTLSAIAAIFDFCETTHEQFYWLHLDMAINRDDQNIFDLLQIKDDHLYVWEIWNGNDQSYRYNDTQNIDWHTKKMNWLISLHDQTNIDLDDYFLKTIVNASTIVMNKNTALKFRNTVTKYVNIFSDNLKYNWSQRIYDDELGFIEETILEIVDGIWKNTDNDNAKICNYGQLLKSGNTTVDWPDYYLQHKHSEAVFIHFWGGNKKLIPDFYMGKL